MVQHQNFNVLVEKANLKTSIASVVDTYPCGSESFARVRNYCPGQDPDPGQRWPRWANFSFIYGTGTYYEVTLCGLEITSVT